MSYAIGVDIGGTKVAVAIMEENARVLAKSVFPTNMSISPTDMIAVINQEIQQLINQASIPQNEITGIGIGAPGPLDSKNGLITCPPNLPNWLNVPIVNEIESYFSLPVFLENDANAAALAEKWAGAAKGTNQFVYITISTGIGAGLYLNGELVSGESGNAGEVGHMVIDSSYGVCTCGQKGCFESIASGTAIAKRGSELIGEPLTTKQVFDLYEQKNPIISPFIEEIFTKIGAACVTLINLFDPKKVVIGGGVSNVGSPLFTAVQRYVCQNALSPQGRDTEVVRSALNQDTGMIGAAAIVFEKTKSRLKVLQ